MLLKKAIKFICFIAPFVFVEITHAEDNQDKNYRLGANDVIKVSVYDHPDLSIEAQLDANGMINFPLIGSVSLNSKTFSEAEKILIERLNDDGVIRNPQVNILIVDYRSQKVAVIGEVNKPGRYALDGKTNLLDMLALAGGISPTGGDKIVVVRDNRKNEYKINDLFSSNRQLPQLKNGDQIFIPRMQQIYVYGEVIRPGAYRLESDMTVMQALSVAGGFTPKASHRSIEIQRKTKSGTLESVDVELTDIVKENDVIYVDESLF